MLAADQEVGAMVEDRTITFRGRVRHWDEAKGSGLAVVDVPAGLVDRLGGRKQYRVAGTLAGAPFTGSGMLVAGGGYCVGVSRAALAAANAGVGDEVDVTIGRA
jgi:NaMN:DMB phosphoribosyltransferase